MSKPSEKIEHQLQENRSFPPSAGFAKDAVISAADYEKMYQASITNPEEFWAEQARTNLEWIEPWKEVMRHDFESIGSKEGPFVEFFVGGKLNVSANCIDRHLDKRRDKPAILWQGEDASQERVLTYGDLHSEVCKFANALKSIGIKKGDVVTFFMPMVPELPIALLACTRIGAIHSVVFSAFSSDSLRNRVNDCGSKLIVTSDVSFHAGKTVQLKEKVDAAAAECPCVENVIVFDRGGSSPAMTDGRDYWWHELMAEASVDCPPEPMDAEDPLFILYTSGSTGKPKGVLHTTGGYLLYTHLTTKCVFDLKEDDIFWCTADIGWITGHSYFTYGPLSNGATNVMFEGTPTYPEPDRFWSIVEKYKVTVFYTAPTAIRALERLGEQWPDKHDLSSLRLLGTVGEPINPEAWIWYHRVIGKENCPIVDTWWQTETGGIMLTTLPGAHAAKPGAAGKPADVDEGGSLTINRPWPGMIRGVYGDPKNELIKKVYFSAFPGRYYPADGCRVDGDGYHWLLGRIDDVINVSAHRFATAEIESSLVAHAAVTEAAVVGFPHHTKGQGIYCYVTLRSDIDSSEDLRKELVQQVRSDIGPIATPDVIHFTPSLPKTRSGKIMRRILRKIAEGDTRSLGDTSTLADPSVIDALMEGRPD